MGKENKNHRWKVPFFKVWIVTAKELTRVDSKIVILEARYKAQLTREQLAARRDADYLKDLVYRSSDIALQKLQQQIKVLREENRFLRRNAKK